LIPNSLSFSRIHFEIPIIFEDPFEFIIFFTNYVSIDYLFRDFTWNSLSVSRFHRRFTTNIANSLGNHNLLSQIQFGFTSWFANWFMSHCYFLDSILNSLSATAIYSIKNLYKSRLRIYFQLTINFINSLRIHYLFREFTLNSLSVSRIHF